MAKAKSRRVKYLLSAKKRGGAATLTNAAALAARKSNLSSKQQAGHSDSKDDLNPMECRTPANVEGSIAGPPEGSIVNPFTGLKFDRTKLNVNIPPPEEWDRKTVVHIHKEITKGRNKKEKAKMKRVLLLKRLEATRQLELDIKDRKRREQTVITKDLRPLLDSLPSVDMKFHQASEKTTGAQDRKKLNPSKFKKDRNSMKSKQKHKEMLKDMAIFKQVLEDAHFKDNPTETMLNHVTLFVQKEYLDMQRAKKEAQSETV